MTERAPVTYRDAGVDIDAGEELVERIKPGVKRSMRREVLGGIGGFGALVEVPLDRYRKPVLVSGTDGVGTKLRLAIDTGRHDTVGYRPGRHVCERRRSPRRRAAVFSGTILRPANWTSMWPRALSKGSSKVACKPGCALVGGETAEMPGHVPTAGLRPRRLLRRIVEKDSILDGISAVSPPTRAQPACTQPSTILRQRARPHRRPICRSQNSPEKNSGSAPWTTTSFTHMATRSIPTVSWRPVSMARRSFVPTHRCPRPAPAFDSGPMALRRGRRIRRFRQAPPRAHGAFHPRFYSLDQLLAGIDVNTGVAIGYGRSLSHSVPRIRVRPTRRVGKLWYFTSGDTRLP